MTGVEEGMGGGQELAVWVTICTWRSGAGDVESPAWRPRRRRRCHPLRQGRREGADLRGKNELRSGHVESVGWKDIPWRRPADVVLHVQSSRTRLTLRVAGPTQAVGAKPSSDPHVLCLPRTVLGWSAAPGAQAQMRVLVVPTAKYDKFFYVQTGSGGCSPRPNIETLPLKSPTQIPSALKTVPTLLSS